MALSRLLTRNGYFERQRRAAREKAPETPRQAPPTPRPNPASGMTNAEKAAFLRRAAAEMPDQAPFATAAAEWLEAHPDSRPGRPPAK